MTKERSSARWVAEAGAYDAWFDRPWGAYATAIEHRLLLDARVPLGPGAVCDAGCGTGRFAERLERHGARVVGVDRDLGALAVAAGRIHGPLVAGDIAHMPFPDRTFDKTFAVTVCEFTTDPAAAIAELVRITKPAGEVVIGALNRRSPWGWWNRRQFTSPPWDQARFFDRATLIGLGARHGRTTWRGGLFAPRYLAGLDRWGRALERLGSLVAPRWAAFGVLTVRLPAVVPQVPAPAGPVTPRSP